jgi:hypothetical protein
LWLEGGALAAFLIGFVGSDPGSKTTSRFILTVALLGAGSLSSLLLLLVWHRRGWRGARWALRVRGVMSLQALAALGLGALPIALVALLAFGRQSLGLFAAGAAAIAEMGVLIAAIRSFKR